MTLGPNTTVSHYKILSFVGKGGMGEVYLAQDTKLNRKAAIKFLNEEFASDSEKLGRFVQEAQATSALNHPNILTVYGIDSFEDKHYIATEYIEGRTLRKVISGKEPIRLNRILKIAIQVAEALAAAHQAGIAHRDIKPENIMVREDGYVKVLDFGLAKLVEKPKKDGDISLEGETKALVKTNPGVVMGTANYMSPEQAQGKETDGRTDIWSLGVILYEMLSRRIPFEGQTVNHTIVAILETEPKLLENVPDELQRIVRKTLTKEKDNRYQTARDLLIDLKNLRRDLDIQGELERSIVPNKETDSAASETASVPGPSGETVTASGAVSTQNLTSTSSLEYAVTQAKSHKLATGVIAILLIAIISAVSYFAFFSGVSNQIESIAVIPFVNESGDPNIEYLSDGMTETLINSLSQVPDLSVKARSLVFQYKGKQMNPGKLASELGVQAILTGRVVQRGEQVSISVELIDGRTENAIWGKQYERTVSALVTLQSEMARDVSGRLTSKLTGEEASKLEKGGTDDPAAYQAYLKGRYYWNRRSADYIKKAIEQFKIATDRDPNYATAFAGLADCYAIFSDYTGTPTSESLPKAKAFAEKALSLDKTLAAPHATLGNVETSLWDWEGSEREFKTAIEMDPDYPTSYHWYSLLLRHLGRNDEAATVMKRAVDLDPMSSVLQMNFANIQMAQGDFAGGLETSLKLVEVDPGFSTAYGTMGQAYLRLGRLSDAIPAFEKASELSKRASFELGDLGYAYAYVGRRSEALAVLRELETRYDRKEAKGMSVASVYVGLGDKDKAFEWLEKDFKVRSGELAMIRWQPPWEPLRNDPRYASLLKRMGLPE